MEHEPTSTRQRVRLIADELLYEEGVTIDRISQQLIYERLGQGSMATIASELRKWKAETNAKLQATDYPPAVMSAVLTLWASAKDDAAAAYAEEREANSTVIEAAKAAQAAAETALVACEQQRREVHAEAMAIRQERDDARHELAILQTRLSGLEQARQSLESALHAREQELKAVHAEKDRLIESHRQQLEKLREQHDTAHKEALAYYERQEKHWATQLDNERQMHKQTQADAATRLAHLEKQLHAAQEKAVEARAAAAAAEAKWQVTDVALAKSHVETQRMVAAQLAMAERLGESEQKRDQVVQKEQVTRERMTVLEQTLMDSRATLEAERTAVATRWAQWHAVMQEPDTAPEVVLTRLRELAGMLVG